MVKNVNRTARLQWKVDTIKNCIYLQCTSIKEGLNEKGFDRCNVKVAHSIMIMGASVAIRSLGTLFA